MNSRPMILRLVSGSVTPASASRKRARSSATTSRTPVDATKSRSTCSASPARSSPWSTKMHVSWSPTARCTMAAATAESTPPERPQMTCASPTCARIARHLLLDHVGAGPVGAEARDAVQEVLDGGLTKRRVLDLWVPLHAAHATLDVLERGDGRHVRGGEHREALGRRQHRVAVAHPHLLLGGAACQLGSSVGHGGDRAAILADARLRDRAAERRPPSPGSRSRCPSRERPRQTARGQ